MLNRLTVSRLLLPLLMLTACGNTSSPEPSAPASIIGSDESSTADPAEVDAPADDLVESEGPDDETLSSSEGDDESPASGEDQPADAASPDVDDTDPDSSGDDEEGGFDSGPDLAAVLPPSDSIEGATASGYTSIDELIADRTERPPLLRCGATDDPTSLAIATQAQAAGRSFDYDDGLRTTTVQLWNYPDTATAERTIALIEALVCDGQGVGQINIDGIEYDQFDSARAVTPAFEREGVDEAVGASFERQLTSTTDLVVQEELQFARIGTIVIFAGAREIRTPDIDGELPLADSLRVGERTIAALLGRAGAGSINSPASLVIGKAEAATYRSSTTGFCLVRIDNADGSTTRASWGAGEQAVLTSSEGQTVEFGEGCGIWSPIDPATATSTLPAGATGTLLVGTDVPGGSLVVTSVGDCSVDQLTGFSGAAGDLISSTILAPGDSIEFDLVSIGIYLASDCRY